MKMLKKYKDKTVQETVLKFTKEEVTEMMSGGLILKGDNYYIMDGESVLVKNRDIVDDEILKLLKEEGS